MDNDIKIFGIPASRGIEDLDSLAAQTERLRESGSLDSAKRLARELAAFSAKSPELRDLAESAGIALTPEREQQLHVMMVFSAQYALREVIAPQLLAEAAITTMNNYLINRSKEFWDTISDGSAFTQYLLAARAPQGQQPALMGEAFARVCGQEDNTDLQQLGAAIFTTAKELIAAKWNS